MHIQSITEQVKQIWTIFAIIYNKMSQNQVIIKIDIP